MNLRIKHGVNWIRFNLCIKEYGPFAYIWAVGDESNGQAKAQRVQEPPVWGFVVEGAA